MAVQSSTEIQNAPSRPFLEEGIQQVTGLSVDPKWVNGIMSTALAALTLPVNMQTSFPLKYYYTTYFATTAFTMLENMNVVGNEQVAISAVDELIYHAVLYLVGKGLCLYLGVESDTLLTLLSSPYIVSYICRQPWFQELKAKLIQSVGTAVIKKTLVKLVEHQGRKYIENKFLSPLKELMNPREVLKNLQESLQESLTAKGKKVREILEEGKETLAVLQAEGVTEHSFWKTVKCVATITSTASKVLPSRSDLRLSAKKHPLVPLPVRMMAAWGIFGSIRPEFTSLALINPESNAGELAIRISAVALSFITGQPFSCTIIAECTIRLTADKLKSIGGQEQLTQLQREISHIQDCIQIPLEECKSRLLSHGVQLKDIQRISKISYQVFAAATYACLNLGTHPFVNALNASSFIQYLGVIGGTFRIAQTENFASTKGYLSSLPFQVIVGAIFTGIECLSQGQDCRPSIAILAALLAMPVVSDAIVSLQLYQTYILDALQKLIIPNASVIQAASFYDDLVARGLSFLPKSTPFLRQLKYLKTLTQTAKYAAALQSAAQIVSHPTTKKVGQAALLLGQKAMAIYGKYVGATTVGYYLGQTAGTLATFVKLPKDKTTVAVATVTFLASSLTQDPLLTSAVTVVANDCFRFPFVSERAEMIVQAGRSTWTRATRLFSQS